MSMEDSKIKISRKENVRSHTLGENTCYALSKDFYPGYIQSSYSTRIRRQITQFTIGKELSRYLTKEGI